MKGLQELRESGKMTRWIFNYDGTAKGGIAYYVEDI